MIFTDKRAKGVSRCLLDTNLKGEPLHYHISEVAPGVRSHPPHQHDGYEAVHVLDGEAVFEIGDERHVLRAGEGVIFDPNRMHGLIGGGTGPVRYLVVLSR
ncbi:MAG TPA: cupin domain-containing protein [Opitutaceae bacterium]